MRAFAFTLFAALPAFVVLRACFGEDPDWLINLCTGFVSFMFAQIWIAAIISASKK